ncbi:MAG: archease [Candidatus Methanoperedens sp.]|nr:archease [Candidatus Methanoperedens sp.]
MPGEKNAKKYEYLYHIADAKFKAYGSTMEESFENAALAMFNVMIDTKNQKPEQMRQIELTSSDIKMLLADWLSELLYLFEVDGIVFCEFKMDMIENTIEGATLSGRAWGETLDLSRHNFDTQVKAVTLHELEVQQTDDVFWVQVVVDT